MKHWELHGTVPWEDQKRAAFGRRNVTAHIVAPTARRALELAEAKYAGLEVYTISHRGLIDYIDEQPAG